MTEDEHGPVQRRFHTKEDPGLRRMCSPEHSVAMWDLRMPCREAATRPRWSEPRRDAGGKEKRVKERGLLRGVEAASAVTSS